MQTNVFTRRSHVEHHIIGVTASGAASQSPNQGKGCGTLVGEHTQLLSFCLWSRKGEKSKPGRILQTAVSILAHTCKPASVKSVDCCHRRRNRGALHIHIALKGKKKYSALQKTDKLYARIHLLESSSCPRKCERRLRVCCTLR